MGNTSTKKAIKLLTKRKSSLVLDQKMKLIVLALCAVCLGLSAALPANYDDEIVELISEDASPIFNNFRIPGFGIIRRKSCTVGSRWCCWDGLKSCCGGRAFGVFCTNDFCPTKDEGCNRLFGLLRRK